MQVQREEFLNWPADLPVAPDCGALSREVAAATLSRSGRLPVRVFGSSMLPAIWPGDVLVVAPAEGRRLGAGDIILFSREDRLFAHRILEVHDRGSGTVLTTRGDALAQADAPVVAPQVLGRVVAVLREGRPVDGWRASQAQKMLAWALRHAGPAYFLLLRIHEWRRRWAGKGQHNELVRHSRTLHNPVVSTKD